MRKSLKWDDIKIPVIVISVSLSILMLIFSSVVFYKNSVGKRQYKITAPVDVKEYTTEKTRVLNMFRYANYKWEEGKTIAMHDYATVEDLYLPEYEVHVGFSNDKTEHLVYAILPNSIPKEVITRSTDGQTIDSLLSMGFKKTTYEGYPAFVREGASFIEKEEN